MRTTLMLMGLVLASCQAYDFEQVEPIFYRRFLVPKAVKSARPDVMLLLDKSGSMRFPIAPDNPICQASPNCGSSGNPNCPAGCPTRITELQAAMPVFLDSAKSQARFGLAVYPQGSTTALQCQPAAASTLIEALPAEGPETTENLAIWAAQTDRIKNYITNTIEPGGGTPTAGSLDFVGTTPGLAMASPAGRKRVVILLTDGLPNCRPGSPNLNNPDPLVTDSVKNLALNGVSTIVIGFGADTQGATILDEMARAGGYPRSCATDANACGSTDFCKPDKTCGRANYSASNATELKAVLEQLRRIIDSSVNPCQVQLGSLDYAHVVVTLNGEVLPEGAMTWTRTAGNSITFAGASCARILDSTEGSQVLIEVGVF